MTDEVATRQPLATVDGPSLGLRGSAQNRRIGEMGCHGCQR